MNTTSDQEELDLLNQLLQAEGIDRQMADDTFPRLPDDVEAQASFQQERLWLLHELDPSSAGMNISAAVRLTGRLNVAALEQALGELVHRHESLRTTFALGATCLAQVIAPTSAFFLPVEDLGNLPEENRAAIVGARVREATVCAFDLRRGPLFRARLLRCGEREHVLVVALHHIIADGWSIGVFTGELGALYGAFAAGKVSPLQPLPARYRDYAAWQRKTLGAARLRAGLDYWLERLRDLPALELPTDRRRLVRPGPIIGGRCPISFPRELCEKLRRLGEAEGATLAMGVLASFQALLHRYTGQSDIAVGIPVANRTHADLEGLIGFFVNMLVIRTDCGGRPSLRELVRRVRDETLAAYDWQDIPFQLIVDEVNPQRHANRHPLFQVSLAFQNTPRVDLVLPELALSRVDEDQTARFDLEVFLSEAEGRLGGDIAYDQRLFDAETVARLAGNWRNLLGAAVQSPETAVALLPLIDSTERHAVIEACNSTIRPLPERGLLARFADQVRLKPGAPAVVGNGEVWSFAEISERAARVAACLRARGFGPEQVAGVWMGRRPELVAAVLGILEAGGAYLPLDPTYPVDRLNFMINDSRATVVLGQTIPSGAPAELWLNVDKILNTPAPDDESRFMVGNEADPRTLAYVIYTSGSTGIPKGTEITRAGLFNYVAWATETYEVAEGEGAPLHTSIAFDLTVTALFPPLLAGRPVRLVPESAGVGGIAATLRGGVNASPVKLTPAHLRILNDLVPAAEASGLARVMVIGGEQLLPEHVAFWRRHAPATRLINEYGPTETVVGCCVYEVTDSDLSKEAVPIGYPIPNTRLYVLDAELEPLPVGVPGELWIAGSGVARGYRYQPDLTADRFRPDPFSPRPGRRMYRTGDRVQRRKDGALEFLGRMDDQLKLRAYRVEPGEIEAALERHEAVHEAVVIMREGRPGNQRLIGYVVPDLARAKAALGAERWDAEHVHQWRMMFDQNYRQPPPADDPTFNIIGWNSSYDGRPMPAGEIRQWLDHTVHQLTVSAPRRVLELGFGSGLILFAIAPQCEEYVGTDFSSASVETVGRLAAERSLQQVRLLQREANDFTGLLTQHYDCVIINSVVQYFSGIDYLLAVLRGAVAAATPGGMVFVGDVRSLPLLPAYHASVQFFRAADTTTREEVADRIRRAIANEEELVIDPDFFHALPQLLPEIARVEIRPRTSSACNELTKFRYDVFLWIGLASSREIKRTDPERKLAMNVAAALAEDLRVLAWVKGEGSAETVGEMCAELRRSGSAPALICGPEGSLACDISRPWRSYANNPQQTKLTRALVPVLRAHLKDRLPEYMIPSAFVLLDRMPLTVNGKVDRRMLPPPPEPASAPESACTPPRGPEEEVLAEIFADLLGLARVGVTDNFFELGGHSLLATQVVTRVRRTFGIELPLPLIFEAPTVAGVAEKLIEFRGRTKELPPLLVPVKRDRPLPLTFSQERLRFLELLAPGSATFHVPMLLRLTGVLNRPAMARAFGELRRRHEVLRTTFHEENGRQVQVVEPPEVFELPCVDLTDRAETQREPEAHSLAIMEVARPFDFARGPFLRAVLYRLKPEEHLLLVVTHHIVSDGWSMEVAVRELTSLYAAFRRGEPSPLPELSLQYGDYACWQRQWMQGETLAEHLAYWRERLADAPTVDLPTDFARPAVLSGRGERLCYSMPRELSERLSRVARERGATLYMALLAGFYAWLQRESGQDDIVVGTSVANREQYEIESLIGFFVNILALRTDAGDNPTYGDFIERTRQVCLEAYKHQDVPFEAVVEAVALRRDLSRVPLCEVVFAFLNTPRPVLELEGLRIAEERLDVDTAKFDLMLMMNETADGLEAVWEFSTDLFVTESVARFAAHFTTLLQAATAAPDTQLHELPLTSASELRNQVNEWNDAALLTPPETTVQKVWEQIAAADPSGVVLKQGKTEATRGELNARANRLAHYLRTVGVRPEVPVALMMDRSCDAVTAMLAVLKAGGYFVPLNPDDPLERISQLLDDIKPGVVLIQEHLADRLPTLFAYVLAVDAESETFAEESPDDLPQLNAPDSLAYVMYTSGSTGVPKGVAVPHRAILRLVHMPNFLSVRPGDVFLQAAPLSFDASVFEIWTPLLCRGRLELMPPGPASLAEIAEVMQRGGVTIAFFTTGLFNQLVDHHLDAFRGLRQLITGGEVCSVAHFQKLMTSLPGLRLIHAYGPTENTVFTSCHTVSNSGALTKTVPIGRPINGTRILILDAELNPVPTGVPGELYTGGVGLARGYLRKPDATADRFVPDPFSGVPGARLYRTGDRARWLVDGTTEFLGRLDQQIKLRGFRIECGEIEAALRRHPTVRDAAVVAHTPASGDNQLAAYVTPAEGSMPEPAKLREFLAARLPDYMVPAQFVVLSELPLGRTGKVNRAALHLPYTAEAPAQTGGLGPRSALEFRLVRIWEEVFGVVPIGVRDGFFDLGGHSLLATRLLAEVERRLDARISLNTLFQHGTIEAMADAIVTGRGGQAFSPLVAIKPEGDRPPFFCVHPGGGSVVSYFALAENFPADQPFYGLQAPGLDGKMAPLRSVEALAAMHLQAIRSVFPDGPYHLGGHSFGGSVAYEMACQLERENHGLLGTLVILDHAAPARVRADVIGEPTDAEVLAFIGRQMGAHFSVDLALSAEELSALDQDARLELFLERAKSVGIAPPGANVGMVAGLVSVYQASLYAMLRYQPGPLMHGLTLFRTPAFASETSDDESAGWAALVRGSVRVFDAEGNHNTMLRAPHVSSLAAAVAAELPVI
jgi:amino acid adenylation domain-containing protein